MAGSTPPTGAGRGVFIEKTQKQEARRLCDWPQARRLPCLGRLPWPLVASRHSAAFSQTQCVALAWLWFVWEAATAPEPRPCNGLLIQTLKQFYRLVIQDEFQVSIHSLLPKVKMPQPGLTFPSNKYNLFYALRLSQLPENLLGLCHVPYHDPACPLRARSPNTGTTVAQV